MGTNTGSLGSAPKHPVNTDEVSFVMPDGTHKLAELVAEAVTDGYTGGKTKVSKMQVIANPGSFTLGDITRGAGSGGTVERGGNQMDGVELTEVDDFSLVVADGGVEVHLVLFQ